jgi:hypothetical protein
MLETLKKLFTKPSPRELAIRELVEAEHSLLIAQTGLEWAKMSVAYNTARITRLKERVKTDSALS